MHVGLGGYSPDAADDPFEIIGAILDQPFLAGPLDKNRREDLQVLSVLEALSGVGALRHRIEVRVGENPPDRYLRHGSREWGTELTELTVQDVRQDLAPVRQFGRELHQRLEARATEFAHLRGRMVTLAKLTESPLPKDHGQLLADAQAALLVDKGLCRRGPGPHPRSASAARRARALWRPRPVQPRSESGTSRRPAGQIKDVGVFWHLRTADGKLVLVQAGQLVVSAAIGEVLKVTPSVNPDEAAVICPALGGNPAS